MNLEKQLERERKNPFHFYIISGNTEKNKKEVFSFLEKDLSFNAVGNSDFHYFSQSSLSIKKAREIKKINSLSKNSNGYRIFFIESNFISPESQNALLKTFEEPAVKTIFFLFLPKTDFLLDTIFSRGRLISGEGFEGSERAEKFLKNNFTEREKQISKILKTVKTPEEREEVRIDFLSFLSEIEIEMLKNKKYFLEKERDFFRNL